MSTVAFERCLNVFDVIVPVRCALCGAHGAHVCEHCFAHLRWEPLLRRSAWRDAPEVYALGAHDGCLRAAVLGLKYRNRRGAAYELGALLGAKLPYPVDLLVPVPLHKSRLRARGFNQAEVIARGIASVISVPVVREALIRIRPTAAQSSLRLSDRARNVREAFQPGPRISEVRCRRMLIVDDVVTTGATIAACADALRSCGVRQILAAALALRL